VHSPLWNESGTLPWVNPTNGVSVGFIQSIHPNQEEESWQRFTLKRGLRAVRKAHPSMNTLSKTAQITFLKITSAQKEAIDWAKANGHSPHVARVPL